MQEAKLNKDYALRVLGVGILMFFICAWSLIDGLKVWPQRNRDMQNMRPHLLATNLSAEAWLQQDAEQASPLTQLFAHQDLRVPARLTRNLADLRLPSHESISDEKRAWQLEEIRKVFEEPIYTARDLQTQFVQAVLTFLLGLWAMALIAWRASRRYCASATSFSGNGFGATPIPYSHIKVVDWRQWENKGIVKFRLQDGRNVRLDGWHYRGVSALVDALLAARPDLKPVDDNL